MAAYATIPLLAFLKYLVKWKVFVVVTDFESVTPTKHRKGEMSITPETRSGFADRLIANRTLLNFGILLNDESVISVDDDYKRRWRNFHQIRNGKIAPQTLRMSLTRAQHEALRKMGVRFFEEFDETTVLYTLDYNCFRWMTDPSLVGRMYFPHDQYLTNKRLIADLEEKLPWVERELKRLSRQIVWDDYARHATRRFFAPGKFNYEYGPSETAEFVGWEWQIDVIREPVGYLPMPDGPRSFASYIELAESRYEILYHLRPALLAVVREFELAAWEHRGRYADRGWSYQKIKRTVWQARRLSDGSTLRRRLVAKTVRVKPGTGNKWSTPLFQQAPLPV